MSKTKNKDFDRVFLQYHETLFVYGMVIVYDKYIVDESIQELFIYLYEKEIQLGNISNIKSYLLTSLRRRILSKKEKIKKEKISADTYISANTSEVLPDNYPKILKSIRELPHRQQEAICLKFFNKLPTKEIAEIMDIQPQVVANTIFKGIKKLRLIH